MSASPTVAQTLRYEGSVGFTRGTYALSVPTTAWASWNGVALDVGPFTLRGSAPVLLQRPTEADGTIAPWRLQVGDPVAQLSFRTTPWRTPSVTLSVGAKIPVRDSLAYGTGRWDVGAGLTVSQRLGRVTFVSAHVSYWMIGDPVGFPLRDPLIGNVSLSGLLGDRMGWTIAATGGQAAVEGLPDFYTVSGGVAWLGKRLTLYSTVVAGLTESAADIAVYVGWSLVLAGR